MGAIEFRPLTADDVECRVSQVSQYGVQLLVYKTARTDMDLLDETVGPENWQCEYRSIDGKLFCGIGCRFGGGEWVWKWDVGVPSNMEAQKGEASDAFKRAGFRWGIGRALYTAPDIWVKRDQCKKIKQGRNGKEQCYDDFRVTEMEVVDGAIQKLVICNASNRMAVVFGSASSHVDSHETQDAQQGVNDVLKVAYQRMGAAIEGWCKRHGCDSPEQVQAKKDGVKRRPEWPSQCKSLEYINAVTREFEDG